MKTGFLVSFFILYALMAKKDLRLSLFLLVALPMSYLIRFSVGGIPLTVLEGMILIVFILWAWRKLRAGQRVEIDQALWPWLGLFLLAATLAIFVSAETRAALGVFKAYIVEPILLFLVMGDVLKRKDIPKFIFMASLGAILVALFGWGQRFFNLPIPAPWDRELRITSVFPYPNAVGLYLAPLIPWWVWKLKTELEPQNRKKVFASFYWLATIILSLVAIYFAKTEAALVALAAVGLVYGLIYRKTRLWTLGAGLVGAMTLVLSAAFRATILEKLLLRDWSGMVRLKNFEETFAMLKASPIFGAGLAGYQEAILPYHTNTWMEIFLYPHNLWLALWSELGLLGVIAFFGIVVWFFRKLWLERGAWPAALMASMSIILIHGLVDVPYFKNDLAVMFWMMLATANLKK